MNKLPTFIFLLSTSFYIPSTFAQTWTLPPTGVDVFGQTKTIKVSSKDTLLDIARQYDIGQAEILIANPNVDRWLPNDDDEVILPSRYIIPDVDRKGLVVNLAEMRIYYFPETKNGNKPVVTTHPVGIGRMDWVTPLGISKIVEKERPDLDTAKNLFKWIESQMVNNLTLASYHLAPPILLANVLCDWELQGVAISFTELLNRSE